MTSHILLFLLPLLLLLSSLASAHDITTILNSYPDFIAFNEILSRTGLAKEINSRTTITVLALDNSTVSGIPSIDDDTLARILKVHVILDFYDTTKISKVVKGSLVITTLYQATGTADDRQGFLNMTKTVGGHVAFGSAMPGSPISSDLVKMVMAKPYNISVLQVSSLIVPPGITEVKFPAPPPPSPPPPVIPPPPADSPGRSDDAADAPEIAEADSPELAASPEGAPTPAPEPAPAPAADAPKSPKASKEADEEDESAARHVAVGIVAWMVIVMAGALLF